MEKNYKVIISVSNYNGCPNAYTSKIDEDTFNKFRHIMKAINDKCPSNTWNWFDRLPDKWNNDTRHYEYDKWKIKNSFDLWFGSVTKLTADDIIEFYNMFTPSGANCIKKIEVLRYEEVEL